MLGTRRARQCSCLPCFPKAAWLSSEGDLLLHGQSGSKVSPPSGGRFGFDLGREWERSVSCEEEVVGRGSELPRLGTSAVGR